MIKPSIGTHALTAKQLPSIQMRKVTNSAAHAPFSCHDSGHGFVWFRYEPRRDPTAFTRTCASRMAHRLRQTSIIFPPVWTVRTIILRMAHQVSWHFQHTNLDVIDVAVLWFLWWIQLHANQPFHPLPHGTPLIGSTFFFRSSSDAFGFFRAASSPFTNLLVLCPKKRALPRSSSTSNDSSSSSSSRPSSKPLQSSKTSPGWVLTGCNFNEVRTRSERGPKSNFGRLTPQVSWQSL